MKCPPIVFNCFDGIRVLARASSIRFLLMILIFLPSTTLSLVSAQENANAGDARQAVVIPSFRDPQRRLEKPGLAGLSFIRFLTSPDFPPFNYVTPDDRIAGFNIDLARALCEKLDLTCIVQVRPWETLAEAVGEARENAVIAGVAITDETRQTYAFTNRYLSTPARFGARKDAPPPVLTPRGLAGRTIGVVEGSAHDAFIGTFFPAARRVPHRTSASAFQAMKAKLVDVVFADGIALAFWLNGSDSEDCCTFVGGPYLESAFFGEGLAIGVAPGNAVLRDALDFALDQVQSDGTFEELYLKHFPVSIY